MAEPLKNIYSNAFFTSYLMDVKKVIPKIKETEFFEKINSDDWENKELKQRMTHIAKVLNHFLDKDFKNASKQIVELITKHKNNGNGFNFQCMFYPEYITLFGLDDFETACKTIEKVTQFTSCEFAVRHFLIKHPEKMLHQMQSWSKHAHPFVRRLASEGMRTRLPWAIKVPHLLENPNSIHPILENLITDESDWVRLSVSNNLNDLAKDFPDFVRSFSKKWFNHSDQVNKVLKHANRSLLKKGDKESLALFGIVHSKDLDITQFNLLTKQVKIGEKLVFEFELKNKSASEIPLRIEYFIYFSRNKLAHYPKVFKISEKKMQGNSSFNLQKQHSFKEITTRKFYPGEHFVSIVINGKEGEKISFDLIN